LQIDHSIKKQRQNYTLKQIIKLKNILSISGKKNITSSIDGIIVKKPKIVRHGKSVTIGILECKFR